MPDFRNGTFVDKEGVSFIVVERQHLIGEIADNEALTSRQVVIRRVDSHGAARDAFLREGNA